jgi:hypothetical protein
MKEAANLAFERKLARQLATAATPPAELQEFVHRALARARLNDIASEPDLAEFCALLLGICGPSPDSAEPKWLRRILTNPKLDGNAKLQQIRARASEASGGGAA